MKYDQFYYSWAPSGISQYNKKGGYGIAASSNGNSDFLRKCESIALNKKPELTDMDLVTEYFQYVESLKTYVFAGVYQIEAPEEMRGRDNSLAHVFVPAEAVDMEDPSSYIRKMDYTSIKRLEAGKDILSRKEIPESGFDYHQLLKKYNLTDCSRLAVLLSMEFEGYFADSKRAIVFPLDSSRRETFSETAREITWLLHSWVPDCLRKSANELRQKLGYVVAGNTSNKNCLCFVPENGEIENNKQRFELQRSYDYRETKNIARGADFYYELARRAQESPQAVTGLIEEICSFLPEVKSINRILDAYECYQIQHLEKGAALPDWDEAGMKRKLDRAKKNDVLAKGYCIDYLLRANQISHSFSLDSRQLKECWDVLAYDGTKSSAKLEEKFRPLVPVFLDMSFQYCSQSKSSDKKLYLEKLELLDDKDSKMWIDSLYRREGGCIHEHLAEISSEKSDGAAILEECLRYYGVPLGKDPKFQQEIFEYTQELYSKNLANPSVRWKIDRCVRENSNVFDLNRWEELVIELLPADSLEFCNKYDELRSKSLKKRWLKKASDSLEEIYEELIQAFNRISPKESKRSRSITNSRTRLNCQCKSWLRLAVNYRMAVDGKTIVEWNWIYEKLNKDLYESFMELLASSTWLEEEKDVRILANQLEAYGSLRRYLDERRVNSAAGIKYVTELEKYAENCRKHVLEESRQKELEEFLAGDAMELYEKVSGPKRKQIRRCMENIPSWEKEIDRKFNCSSLEEFLRLPLDLEEDYPGRWDRERTKFAQMLANYDAIMSKRGQTGIYHSTSGREKGRSGRPQSGSDEINGIAERSQSGSDEMDGAAERLQSGFDGMDGAAGESQSAADGRNYEVERSVNGVMKFQSVTEKSRSRFGKGQREPEGRGAKDEGNQIILKFLNQ